MKKYQICVMCEDLVVPKKKVKGLSLIELSLWIFFIIPGLIYSLLRKFFSDRYYVCSQCNGNRLVPLSSTRGRRILLKLIQTDPEKYRKLAAPPNKKLRVSMAFALITFFIGVLVLFVNLAVQNQLNTIGHIGLGLMAIGTLCYFITKFLIWYEKR